MVDFYHDTERRMRHDAKFNNAVQMLMMLAREHGFTPGELQQIAFRAAYEIEMREPRVTRLSEQELLRMQLRGDK